MQDDGRRSPTCSDACLCPPMFPISLDAFPGGVDFRAVGDEQFQIGDIEVMSRLIPHVGNTCGYRLSWGGASVAYLSDHQQPGVDVFEMSAGARELCEGVDLLIHDAQYTPEEFAVKSTWGHCTVDYAVWLAAECGVKTLALVPPRPDARRRADRPLRRRRQCPCRTLHGPRRDRRPRGSHRPRR